jgi:hypothetical protein
MPKTFTSCALDTREESATAKIRTDGSITRRRAPTVASKITATATRHVPIKATTATTSRALAVIGTAKTILSLFDTVDARTITLDPTQRELVIEDRIRIPITSHPPYPWRGQTNIPDASRSIHVNCRGNTIDAQIGREVTVIILREISINLRLKCSNHIGILGGLDVPQEHIRLRTGTEEHVVLSLKPEVEEVCTAERKNIRL